MKGEQIQLLGESFTNQISKNVLSQTDWNGPGTY